MWRRSATMSGSDFIARPRSAGGYRVSGRDGAAAAVRAQRTEAGFSLKEIASLAGMATKGVTCAEMCARMDEKLSDIDREIRRLAALRRGTGEADRHVASPGSVRQLQGLPESGVELARYLPKL